MQTCRPWRATIASPDIQKRAGHQESNPAHNKGRNRLDGVPDREIGRSPHQVDRSECGNDLRARCLTAPVPISQTMCLAARRLLLLKGLFTPAALLVGLSLLRFESRFLRRPRWLRQLSF